MNKEFAAKKEGKLNFDSLGNHTSKDVSKDVDEFLLGNRHASRVIFLLGGVLKKEIQEKDSQVLEAKELTLKNKEKDKIAAEKLGLKTEHKLIKKEGARLKNSPNGRTPQQADTLFTVSAKLHCTIPKTIG